MKAKFLLALGIFAVAQLQTMAQKSVNITFMVDCSTYKGNVPLLAQNIKIGGNFTDVGATIPNWDALGSPTFTKVGDKLFSATIAFDSAGFGDTLKYKFIISTGDWGTCGVLNGNTQECIPVDSPCWGLYDDYRILRIEKTAFTVAYFYNTCTRPGTLSAKNIPSLKSVSLAPNPATSSSYIAFDATETGDAKVEIFNAQGQVLQENNYSINNTGPQSLHLPITIIPAGIYFVRVQLNNRSTTVRMVLAE